MPQLDREIKRARKSQLDDGCIDPVSLGIDDEEHWISKVYATGHTLEWVLTYSGREVRHRDWIVAAVGYLAEEVMRQRGERCPASPRLHALHALQMADPASAQAPRR